MSTTYGLVHTHIAMHAVGARISALAQLPGCSDCDAKSSPRATCTVASTACYLFQLCPLDLPCCKAGAKPSLQQHHHKSK